MSFTPQTTVSATPAIALAGMVADSGFKDIVSRVLTATCLAGLFVCGDADNAEPPDAAADVTGHGLGGVAYEPMTEPSTTGFAIGHSVSVVRWGRVWMTTLAGAAPTDGAAVYVYRGATAADRGKVTQDSGAGSTTRADGCRFTGKTASGLAEVQFEGIGVGDQTVPTSAELASAANGQGASLIGAEDAGGFTTAATVEAQLAEIFQQLYSIQRDVPVNIASGMLAAGTPLAAFADNAGASAPGITLADSKAAGVRWNNQGTQTAVWYKAHFPQNIDDAADIIMHFAASKTGATVGDATKFTVTAFINAPGSLHDADADFGGDSSAMTGNATAKTIAELTLTLGNADIPAAPFSISFSVKPKDGTLGTDDAVLHDVWFEIKSKKVTS